MQAKFWGRNHEERRTKVNTTELVKCDPYRCTVRLNYYAHKKVWFFSQFVQLLILFI